MAWRGCVQVSYKDWDGSTEQGVWVIIIGLVLYGTSSIMFVQLFMSWGGFMIPMRALNGRVGLLSYCPKIIEWGSSNYQNLS